MHATGQPAYTLARNLAAAFCVTLFASTASAEAAEPKAGLTPFEASYTASMDKGISINGNAKRTLTPQGNNVWLYRTDVNSFIADIDESLVLKWENNRVVPLRYRYRLSGLFIKDRKESIDFDWDASLATGTYKGKQFELKLKPGALDPLGYQLQLHQDLKAGKREMAYQVIDGNSYDHDRFAVIEQEPLETAQGSMTTLKAEKVREEGAKRQTLMWFAPNEAFLLVRLLQIEPDGSRYELNLQQADLKN